MPLGITCGMVQQKQLHSPTETNQSGILKTAQIDTTTPCMESSRKYITRQEASDRYGLSVRKIDMLIEDGTLPAAHISKRCIRIPIEKADAAIDALGKDGAK